jgi:hypothetical protein
MTFSMYSWKKLNMMGWCRMYCSCGEVVHERLSRRTGRSEMAAIAGIDDKGAYGLSLKKRCDG